MELEKLILAKEEISITNEICFQVPIHPSLLDPNLEIDKNIARRIFQDVTNEWYEDLQKYAQKQNPKIREEIERVYLKQKPVVKKDLGNQFAIETWGDFIETSKNGLVTCFSISRNHGGTLYFLENDFNCKVPASYCTNFSKEKEEEFKTEKGEMFVYAQHNIDSYPGALFLRNWAMNYMNEVFKTLF